ncbi:Non-specific serine/threonine protein kinase [Handroanthus impetiginosus]|uniref:Non-specific serine/threonine protein kinase n=1 Tax=Handroanthus impetiginosus TaxID=429701 RepID=A0A2G9GYV3_9LAMI|nr:Non-specific serine/threonine protein kinase [Handroanthus impetiginosus]
MKFIQLPPLLLVLSEMHSGASKIRCLQSERQGLLKSKDELIDAYDDDDDDIYAPLKGMISTSLLELQHLQYLDLSNLFKFSTLALIYCFSNFSNTGFTTIYFGGNRMPGPLPNVFASMTSLARLPLNAIGLEGAIPNYFGNMSSLIYLHLSENSLTRDLFELTMNLSRPVQGKLQYLNLGNNGISGSFSNMSRFSSPWGLFLSENQLNRSTSEGYLKLPHLTELDLSSNELIESLFLGNNKLNGTLPESYGRLSKLRAFLIGSHFFKGIITEDFISDLSQLSYLHLSLNLSIIVKFNPHWVPPFQLTYLRLGHCILGPHFSLWLKTQRQLWFVDISSAGISNNLPTWFVGNLASDLVYLDVSDNHITGVFPDSSFSTIGPSLSIDISRNHISGSITVLCHVREWNLIDLSNNHFFGHIPDCFSHFERLRYLNLANNNFSGKIPLSFSSLSALSLLHLCNNSFSGELPISMANLTDSIMIDILNLSSNKIYGVIPNCIRKYLSMTKKKIENILVIANYTTLPENMLHILGMPEVIDYTASYGYPLDEIYQLQSAYFMWKGKEVKYVSNLCLVQIIDLSNNNLVGQIPSNITKLVDLDGLNFSTNNLSGPIPRNIGNLKSLDFPDFSRNHLFDTIPAGLGKLTLRVLNFSYINLSSKIPPIPQLQTYELAYIGNLDLRERPLNKFIPGDESSHQDPNSGNNAMNNEEFEEDKFVNGEFYIAFGVGFLVGFWEIFGTILLNKATRHAFFMVLKKC